MFLGLLTLTLHTGSLRTAGELVGILATISSDKSIHKVTLFMPATATHRHATCREWHDTNLWSMAWAVVDRLIPAALKLGVEVGSADSLARALTWWCPSLV